MANKERYTAKKVRAAIEESKGMVYFAARRLGCHHQTVYNYIKRYESVREEFERQNGLMGDMCELKLYEAIQAGKLDAIKYWLSTKGKDRGYVERQEVTGADGGPVAVKAYIGVSPDDWDDSAAEE